MTRKSKRELERELEALEEQFAPAPTELAVLIPDNALADGDDRRRTWPDGVDRSDLTVTDSSDTETVAVPHHRPESFCEGLVMLSTAEVAQIYAIMPDGIRAREIERRREREEQIPPVLEVSS